MNIREALHVRVPQRHKYASTLFPETIYAPTGIEVHTRLYVKSEPSPTQQAEIERLHDAGVRFYDREKGHHLALEKPSLTYSPDGNRAVIHADAGEGDYVVSRALLRPSSLRRSERQAPIEAKTVGAGIVVRTADKKFIGVTRSQKNGNYSGFREVSASGGITIKRVEPAMNVSHVIEDTMREEIREEMKISAGEAASMPILPIVMIKDERLPHLAIGYVGQSSMTAQEIVEGQHQRAEQDDTPHDFSESLHIVGGEPEELREYILRRDLPPMTPLARELWLAAGARLIFEKHTHLGEKAAQAKAEKWRKSVRREANALYRRFDRDVRRYYRTHPEALVETERPDKPQRYWSGGIDAAASPERQGLRRQQQEEILAPSDRVEVVA